MPRRPKTDKPAVEALAQRRRRFVEISRWRISIRSTDDEGGEDAVNGVAVQGSGLLKPRRTGRAPVAISVFRGKRSTNGATTNIAPRGCATSPARLTVTPGDAARGRQQDSVPGSITTSAPHMISDYLKRFHQGVNCGVVGSSSAREAREAGCRLNRPHRRRWTRYEKPQPGYQWRQT
jgi:hypothetical protein